MYDLNSNIRRATSLSFHYLFKKLNLDEYLSHYKNYLVKK